MKIPLSKEPPNQEVIDFIFEFGKVIGGLSRPDVRQYLHDIGVSAENINKFEQCASTIIAAFYRDK